MRGLTLRANYILQKEGLIPLVKNGITFLIGFFLRYETHYLYEFTLKERNEADFIPKVNNFTLQIITTNQQAGELKDKGFDLEALYSNTRKLLDNGAIAFCILVGQELAYTSWLAMTEETKDSFRQFPFHVDFSNKEACTGGTITTPKYRGKGLMTYGKYKQYEFLRERGIIRSRGAVNTNNITAQRVQAKFEHRIYAKAFYLKILRWQFWRETPLVHD
jgi:hypothetical protein